MTTTFILVTAAIFLIFGIALINWSVVAHKNAVIKIKKVQALQIAEAGVNYYKWHLAHDFADYKDGNNWCCDSDPGKSLATCGGVCGPYEHEYRDNNNNIVGNYSLKVTPPIAGSTIFSVESTGSVTGGASSVEKKIISRVGKRSLAEYSFLTKSPIWIGLGEATSGPLHSNGGVRFDDTTNSEITSSVVTYDCAAAGHGCASGTMKDGIWGSGGPVSFWNFPVPEIDFGLFTVNLADIKTKAIADGIYFGDNSGVCGDGVCGRIGENNALCPADCSVSCGNGVCNGGETNITCAKDCSLEGFRVKFNANATIDVYSVNTLQAPVQFWHYPGWNPAEAEQINNSTLLGNYPMPANGLIFIENDVWVDGIVNGKATIGSAIFPIDVNNYAKIRINNNINYTARDGNDSLGLMAQGDVLVPRYAPTNLIIDAMLLSQEGHVYFRPYRTPIVKDSIEVYGGVITNLFWTWSYVNGSGVVTNGYTNTNTIYNNNLTFAPPPSFPTSEKIEVLSWKEE